MGNPLDIGRKNGFQEFRWSNPLFGVCNTEQIVKFRLEGNLASPPVVIVFFTLLAHKEPPKINFSSGPNNRNSGALRNSEMLLLIIRKGEPRFQRQSDKF